MALGFWVGPGAYLRSSWNVMDGFLVVVSWIDVIVTLTTDTESSILGVLRVFRALRTLRPLRVISRAPGLKIVVETLISSLKPIGNIVLIAATFFIIFGILGVQVISNRVFAGILVQDKQKAIQNIKRGIAIWNFAVFTYIGVKLNLILADSTATIFRIKQKDSIKWTLPEKFIHIKISGIYRTQLAFQKLANFDNKNWIQCTDKVVGKETSVNVFLLYHWGSSSMPPVTLTCHNSGRKSRKMTHFVTLIIITQSKRHLAQENAGKHVHITWLSLELLLTGWPCGVTFVCQS